MGLSSTGWSGPFKKEEKSNDVSSKVFHGPGRAGEDHRM
jgi:hypothetical protein